MTENLEHTNNLRFIAGEKAASTSKSKVFCVFHPKNKNIAKEVMHDIITAFDCTVFYYEDGECTSESKDYENDLAEMNLFVIIISSDYLFTKSFAREVIYDYAVSHTIPVLPIMIENELDEPFTKHMGNLQYLLYNSESYDVTSVPYSEKLKNYLSRIFTVEENKKALKEAFDACIFLSYRKKDRHYAQELMRLIHEDESCRGISIWYDEFLVPGENFNDEIKAELEGSSIVILTVTPHITENDNYIVLTEYPAAVSMSKTVIPMEMRPTNQETLFKMYAGLPDVVPTDDAETVRLTILRSIESLGIKLMESSSEKEFLRGLAYLKGIYVEKNPEIGVMKILNAAEDGVPEAVTTLASMYRNGEGVSVSVSQAILWQNKYIDIVRNSYDKNLQIDNAKELVKAYFELGDMQKQTFDYTSALETYNKIVHLCLSENLKNTDFFAEVYAAALLDSGAIYMLLGDYFSASAKCFEKVLKKKQQLYNEKASASLKVSICELYALLAECCEMCRDVPGAKNYTLQLIKELPSVCDINTVTREEYTLTERILSCNNKLGHLYVKFFEYKTNEAFICIGNSVILAEKLVEISDSYSAGRHLIQAHINDGDQHANRKTENHLRSAEEAYSSAYFKASEMSEKYDEMHELKRDLAMIIQKQAFVKSELGDNDTALALYESAVQIFFIMNIHIDSLSSRKDLYDCMRDTAITYRNAGNIDACTEKLLESVGFAKMNVAQSDLAVYKKDEAASHELLAEIYKKQWDMEEAFTHTKAQCDLLRAAMNGTGLLGDVKLFANAISKALPIAKLAGNFDEAEDLQKELNLLLKKYEGILN